MNDIDDGTRSCGLKVFEKRAGVSAVCIGRVYALCGEVVELFEVGVPGGLNKIPVVRSFEHRYPHNDLFLISIFKGFGSPDRVLSLCTYRRTPS